MLVVKKDGGKEEEEGERVLKKGMQGRQKRMGGGRIKDAGDKGTQI